MPSLSDLLRMGKQYIGDALPGGSLNPEVSRQSVLDGAAMALSPVPVLGDIVGLGADANRYATDPESRTPVNYGLTALGALPFIPSMTAWHASPYKFDKFKTEAIGTGQGAQSYGHGLYLAEAHPVGLQYLEEMKGKAASDISSVENLVQIAKNVYGNKNKSVVERSAAHDELVRLQKTLEDTKAKYSPSLYKTDIPDEAVARFLDWDKPLSQQAPEVRSALTNTKNKHLRAMVDYANVPYSEAIGGEAKTMGEAYRLLNLNLQGKASADSVKASSLLAKQGIPGIRYLDGGSRSAGQGSSNFVAFDPEMIRILERNGIPTGNKPWNPGEWRPISDLLNPRID